MPSPKFPQRPAPARRPGAGRRRRLSAPALALLALLLAPLLLAAAACSDASGNLGRYYEGQTLHINVLSIERLPELRYATIDPTGVVRDWRLAPAAPGMELALVQVRVENHTAISAAFNVESTTVELRDFTNRRYFPVGVGVRQQRDYRGADEAVVRMDLGQCFDFPRTVITQGTAVRWVNAGETAQLLDFADPSAGPSDAEAPVGGSLSYPFAQPGAFDYQCSSPEGRSYPAQIEVVGPDDGPGVTPRSVTFLEGPFELERGFGLEGALVFEVPAGTEFRDFRWKAGDSITVRF